MHSWTSKRATASGEDFVPFSVLDYWLSSLTHPFQLPILFLRQVAHPLPRSIDIP